MKRFAIAVRRVATETWRTIAERDRGDDAVEVMLMADRVYPSTDYEITIIDRRNEPATSARGVAQRVLGGMA